VKQISSSDDKMKLSPASALGAVAMATGEGGGHMGGAVGVDIMQMLSKAQQEYNTVGIVSRHVMVQYTVSKLSIIIIFDLHV